MRRTSLAFAALIALAGCANTPDGGHTCSPSHDHDALEISYDGATGRHGLRARVAWLPGGQTNVDTVEAYRHVIYDGQARGIYRPVIASAPEALLPQKAPPPAREPTPAEAPESTPRETPGMGAAAEPAWPPADMDPEVARILRFYCDGIPMSEEQWAVVDKVPGHKMPPDCYPPK